MLKQKITDVSHKAATKVAKAPHTVMHHTIDFLVVSDIAHSWLAWQALPAIIAGIIVVLFHAWVNANG